MLLSRLENQKGIRKRLVDLLFKKGYCLCIPDPVLVQFYLGQVRPSWIQKFFLSKNALQLAVIPMFMLIFVKNKRLTIDQSQRLLELLHMLMLQAEEDTIDQLFFDNKIKQLAWPYYFLNELIKFPLADFVKSEANSQRITAMAAALEFFLQRANTQTLIKFCLNDENSGFNVIQKLLYVIAYENLHSSQIIYLSSITQKIINKMAGYGLEILCLQKHRNGYSFIWCALGTWLQLVFERENFNQIKINYYTELINTLIEEIDNEKISSIVLENENNGSNNFTLFFFKRLQLSIFHHDLIGAFEYFNVWCKKIFSALTFPQIELILKKLPLILSNDPTLSMTDRRQLLRDFFDNVFDCCKLKTQEIAAIKDLKEQLEKRYFTGNRLIKFFRQVRTHWHFFNGSNYLYSINKTDEISLDETSDLLSPEYARLNANYLTMSM